MHTQPNPHKMWIVRPIQFIYCLQLRAVKSIIMEEVQAMLLRIKQTVPREWVALYTLSTWFFSGYQSYDPTLLSNSETMFFFLIALGVPMVLLGLKYSNNIEKISTIATFSAPVGIVLTAAMAFFPSVWFKALFIASAPFVAPLILRCCYGAVAIARYNRKLTSFMLTLTFAIFTHVFWLLTVMSLGFPPYIQFLFPALMALVSYLLTRKGPPEYVSPSRNISFMPSKGLFTLVSVFLLLVVFDFAGDLFHEHFIDEGLSNNLFIYVAGVFLPAACLTLYAALADRGFEKLAVTVGLSIHLIMLVLTLFQREAFVIWPLLIANGIGSAYEDFFAVGFFILFFAESGKPVLMASLGLAVDILTSSIPWALKAWAPPALFGDTLSAEHLVFMAVLAVILLVTATVAFDRRKEKTFAISLLSLLVNKDDTAIAQSEISDIALNSPAAAELLPIEQKIAVHFIDGYTKHDISRQMHIPTAEVIAYQESIISKITNAVEKEDIENRLVKKAIELYGIRERQAQILRCVVQNQTNAQISETHQITVRTVKYHIAELLSKTGTKNRHELVEKLYGDVLGEL